MKSGQSEDAATWRANRLRAVSAVCLVGSVLVATGLFVGTHLPPSKVPGFVLRIAPDKVLHGVGYGTLAFLLYGGIRRWVRPPWRTWLAVVLAVAILSALDELTQPLTGRDRDLLDFLASTGGATFGAISAVICESLLWRVFTAGRSSSDSL